MARLLDRAETLRQLEDLPGWDLLADALHTRFEAPDVPTAVELVRAAFEEAEEMDHHPDVDVRWRRVRVVCTTHSAGGVTQLDVELAHRVERLARRLGAEHRPPSVRRFEVGIDTRDAARVSPFWAAVLDYAPADEDGEVLVDPRGLGPAVWFQVTDGAATGRNRLHVDVSVVPQEAPVRIAAALAAGGRLVTDAHAPKWWVLADADGNEVCVCTEEGRGR